jgi:hypothetical protein
MRTQFGTQKCAERAVEAVDAVHAVEIFFGNLVLVTQPQLRGDIQ